MRNRIILVSFWALLFVSFGQEAKRDGEPVFIVHRPTDERHNFWTRTPGEIEDNFLTERASMLDDGKNRCIELRFTVNSNGKPKDISTICKWPMDKDDAFERDTIALLSRWQFEPTKNNANRVPVSSTQRFTYFGSGREPDLNRLKELCPEQ